MFVGGWGSHKGNGFFLVNSYVCFFLLVLDVLAIQYVVYKLVSPICLEKLCQLQSPTTEARTTAQTNSVRWELPGCGNRVVPDPA